MPAAVQAEHAERFLKKLESEEKIMLYLNKIIEDWILKYPEQWIWVHDRWKN